MTLNGRQCSVPVCYQILYAITRNTSYLDLTANATCSYPNYASVMILTSVTAMQECTMYDVLQTYYSVLYMFVCVVLPRMHLTITLPSRVITYCYRQSCYGPETTGLGPGEYIAGTANAVPKKYCEQRHKSWQSHSDS